MSSIKVKSSGFTLLEVLIALTILAISSLAVINQTAQSVQQRQRLEQKTIALWVAENQLNALRVVKEWPSPGRRSDSITLLNMNWRILTEVSTTADPLLRKITVNVAIDDGDQERDIAYLTGFRGRY